MSPPCAYCYLPRKNLNVYGLCRRCAFVIHVITGHPDLPSDETRAGVKSKHAQTLSLDSSPRGRVDGGGRQWAPGREFPLQ